MFTQTSAQCYKPEYYYDELFNGLNGYSLSHNSKKDQEHPLYKNTLYGESLFDTVKEIFTHPLIAADVKKANTFYDLGSGTGTVCVALALLKMFEKCHGVELLDKLYHQSLEQKTKLQSMDEDAFQRVEFFNNSFLDHDFSDADIVFANHPTTDKGIWAQLEKRLNNELKKDAIVTFIIHTMDDQTNFNHLGSQRMKFGWGDATCHFYKKVA